MVGGGLCAAPSNRFLNGGAARRPPPTLTLYISKNNKNILTNSFWRVRIGPAERRNYPWKELLSSSWQRC